MRLIFNITIIFYISESTIIFNEFRMLRLIKKVFLLRIAKI